MKPSPPHEADSDRWRRVEELCDGALGLAPRERAAYLSAECGADEALRREVETLLMHEHSAEPFLEHPVDGLAARGLAGADQPDLVGARVGDYHIVARLGAGGMGVVYRARDLRLGRDVAIKVLPPGFALDELRHARFEREARLLATVNHPNIASIYGLLEADGIRALVLELIEGETLAGVLARGRFSLQRGLAVGAQIADALEHAHRRGITHRDLKPSNIMLTADCVKLVDFGIGKWTPPDAKRAESGFSSLTEDGALVGTIHYMSPEQLEGRDVDTRADLFSFGTVLFEMLAGRPAFDGPSRASIIAAILEGPTPRLPQTPGVSSPRLDRVVAKCLAKDRDQRWQSARDLADELRWLADEVARPATADAGGTNSSAGPAPVKFGARTTIATAIVIATAVVAWAAWTRWPVRGNSPATTGVPVRFVVQPPPGAVMLAQGFDVSPDGTQLVYAGSDADGRKLYLRQLDRLETISLRAAGGFWPAYSPDGEWVAFARNGLEKVRATADSSPVVLADAVSAVHYLIWPTQDNLFFASRGRPLHRLFAEGGLPADVTTVVPDDEIDHHTPELLPGGDALLFAVHGQRNRFSLAVQALKSGVRKTLIESGFAPQYSPTGHVVFARGSAVLAVPFDVERLEVTGPPVTMIQGVATVPTSGEAAFRLSATGTMVYQPERSSAGRMLTWVDRAGHETPLPLAARAFDSPRVSPDGKLVAFSARDGERRDIWTYELASGKSTRVTDDGDNWGPLWTRDSLALVHARARVDLSEVILQRLDGNPPVTLGASANDLWPAAFAADQKTLVVNEVPPTDDYFVSQLTVGIIGRPQPLIAGPNLPRNASVSPDGRWVAYAAAGHAGRSEIFVQGFPVAGARRQVTVDGGGEPVWRRDGKELFYRWASRMFAVSIDTARGLSWGKPELLFESNHVETLLDYDVAPDNRFLMIKPAAEEGAPIQLNVVLNWASELLARAPLSR